MKQFRCDIRVWATVYVKAEDEADARAIIETMNKDFIEVNGGKYEEIENGELSPAMTIDLQDDLNIEDVEA